MAFLSWRKEYEVGVAQIDAEHRGLFALINAFHDACARDASGRETAKLLNRLVAYTERHFQHEERLMSDNGYPRLDGQRKQHSDLVASIFAINERLAVDSARASAETVVFIKNWLVEHIVKSDMDIGDFLRRKDKRASPDPRGEASADTKEQSLPELAKQADQS